MDYSMAIISLVSISFSMLICWHAVAMDSQYLIVFSRQSLSLIQILLQLLPALVRGASILIRQIRTKIKQSLLKRHVFIKVVFASQESYNFGYLRSIIIKYY